MSDVKKVSMTTGHVFEVLATFNAGGRVIVKIEDGMFAFADRLHGPELTDAQQCMFQFSRHPAPQNDEELTVMRRLVQEHLTCDTGHGASDTRQGSAA